MRSRISVLNPAITLLTTIIVATPSITLMMLARAMYRVRRYRRQSRALYIVPVLWRWRSFQRSQRNQDLGFRDWGERGASAPRCLSVVRAGLPFRIGAARFGTQQREENHVADAVAVRQQHHQAVDADAQPPGRWHADFQRPEEFLVHLGHRFLFRKPRQLRAEQFLLQP